MTLLSLLLVACAPHDATVEANYAYYMASENSDAIADLHLHKRFDAQKDLIPVDCRTLDDETLRLPGADPACVGQSPVWFPWLANYSYYLKEGKVTTDDDIYRTEAVINSEGDLQLTFHFNIPDYGEARFGWVIKPDFQPKTCALGDDGKNSLQDVDGDWLGNWSSQEADAGYTVWHLNAGAYQINPNDFKINWSFMPDWVAGVSYGRFGADNISHHPTDYNQNSGETADNPLYLPMFDSYSNTNVPLPGGGSLDDWANAIRTNLTDNDDLTRMGSAGDFKLNYRVDSNSWRPTDDIESGLDNWVEVSLGYVRIKNFDIAAIKAGKTNVEGDFQLFLQGSDAPSRLFVQGKFTIDHLSEVTAYSPTLEDVKMEEKRNAYLQIMRFEADRTQLLLIDWQQRLLGAMPEAVRDQAQKSAENLLFLAEALGMPVLLSEQYPQGLGATVPGLVRPGAVEKLSFSAVQEPKFAEQLCRPQVLVCGMETHICVALTVADLRARGLEVGVVADACLSRRKGDWERGLQFCARAGAKVLSAETVLFGMIGRAGTPLFKEISRRIR